MISETALENFSSKFTVVSCFVEHNDEILLLKRHSSKPQGEMWCLPAGKVDQSESEMQAIVRELQEETGIAAPEASLQQGSIMYVRYPDYDFMFVTYSLPLASKPAVVLNPNEHTEYIWQAKNTIHDLPLIPHFIESMHIHYKQNKNEN